MAKKPGKSMKDADLRRQAEDQLRVTNRDVAAMPVQDVQRLVHELQVHQIELEMQNEELRRTQAELEAARDRYADLYNFSPAGHLTLYRHGTIMEANLRAGTLLGFNLNELVRQPLARFIAAEDAALYQRHCQEVLKAGTRQTCEVRLRAADGILRWVHLESLAVHEEPGPATHWRMALLDISARKRAERELDMQRAQLQAIIGSAMDAIITVDEEQRVVLFNGAAESMFLCTVAEAIGQPLDRFIPERFRPAHHGHVRGFSHTEKISRSMDRRGALKGLRANGEEFPFEASLSHVVVAGQQFFTVILRDVTERKLAEETLRNREHEFHLLADNVPAFYAYIDPDLRYRFVNKRYEAFFGRPTSEIMGLPVKEILGARNFDQIEPKLRAAVGGQSVSFVYPMALPDGDARWMNVQYTPDGDDTGRIRGVLALVTDVTAQKQAELALQQNQSVLGEKQEELQILAEKLLTAQDEERKRIARELHDDFNQRLASLSVELETLERAPLTSPEPVDRQLAAIRGRVGRLSDDLHDLAYKLHPSLLEHVGLEVAMRDHVAEFMKRTGLPVTFIARDVPGRLSPEKATNLFRVMQESLQNVAKHANATAVTVRLSGSPKGIGVSVRDNGQGFDLESRRVRVKGLGLVSMQERARALGGFLRIHSLPTEGTKVCAWIPGALEGA